MEKVSSSKDVLICILIEDPFLINEFPSGMGSKIWKRVTEIRESMLEEDLAQ